MPTSSKNHIRKCLHKRRNKLNRAKVLKILAAAMENVDGEASSASTSAGAEPSSDFFNTGRVGRRNAMPDILSSHATVSTADLPDQLSALTTSDKSVASTSSSTMDIQSSATTSQISNTTNS